MRETTCPVCGKTFVQVKLRGRPRKYCSDSCNPRLRRKGQSRPGRRSRIWVVDCWVCGAAYTSRREDRSYCNRPDCVAADKKHRLDEMVANWDGDGCPFFNPDKPTSGYYKHVRGGQEPCEQCRQGIRDRRSRYRSATNRRGEQVTILCEWCGRYKSKRKRYGRAQQRWCSLDCRRAHENDVRSSRYAVVPVGPSCPRSDLPRLHPARQEPAKVTGLWAKVFVQGPCSMCGTEFCSGATSVATAPKYCSKRCSTRANRHRHGRFWVPDYVRQAIYDRDGWKCQLCGKRVGKKYPPGHNRGATLDHIIPQSKGGSDNPENLQLAHMECNRIKRDNVWKDGEQLRLVG